MPPFIKPQYRPLGGSIVSAPESLLPKFGAVTKFNTPLGKETDEQVPWTCVQWRCNTATWW